MKLLNFPLFVFLIFALSSCSKDGLLAPKIPSTPDIVKANDVALVTTSCGAEYKKITLEAGIMLSFNDEAHFRTVLKCLEQDQDNYNDAFNRQHANYSEEDLNDLIDRTGFEEEQPLIDFERSYSGFASLRAKIEHENLVWEAAATQKFEELPEVSTIADHILRTILTENCEVKIAGKIVNFCDGATKALNNCNSKGCCKFGIHYGVQFVGNDRAVVKMLYFNGGLWSHVSSSIISYRRAGNRWRRFRSRKTAEYNIYLRSSQCKVNLFERDDRTRNRRRVSVGHTFFNRGPRVGPRDVFGEYVFLGTNGDLELF